TVTRCDLVLELRAPTAFVRANGIDIATKLRSRAWALLVKRERTQYQAQTTASALAARLQLKSLQDTDCLRATTDGPAQCILLFHQNLRAASQPRPRLKDGPALKVSAVSDPRDTPHTP